MPESTGLEFEDVLQGLGIEHWDYFVVTDGSGSTFDRGMGYASVVVDRDTLHRQILYGAANLGTVTLAETLASIQAVEWIVKKEADRSKRNPRKRIAHIHIITDSEYLEGKGQKGCMEANKNIGLLSILSQYARKGLILKMHHAKREELMMNSFVDRVSRLARLLLTGYNVCENVVDTDGSVRSVYDCNRLKDPQALVGLAVK